MDTTHQPTQSYPKDVRALPHTAQDSHVIHQDATKLSWLDLAHQHIGDAHYFPTTGNLDTRGNTDGASYISLGEGNEIIITTSAADLVTLHQIGLSSRTVAPLDPNDLFELCRALKTTYPNCQYHILGIREHAHMIQVTKEEIGCRSGYPHPMYQTWAEFLHQCGIGAIKDYLLRSDTETKAMDPFIVRQEHVACIQEQRFLFENLIINQHIAVICASPNAGKTTIMNWVCGQISETNDVRYINLDCSGSDLKHYQEYAHSHGFEFLNFDVTGTSLEAFFTTLEEPPDLTGKVYVFDTLKKIVDPMRKDQVSALMKRLRRFSNKGATFVLLSHTNKHRSKDGVPIFEGVGDVRADCDDLIYLIPDSHPDGSMTVNTLIDKSRGAFEPMTFNISRNRDVSLTEYVDILALHQSKADESIINTVTQLLTSGPMIQKDIIDACVSAGHGKNKVSRVLTEYASKEPPLWTRAKGANNSWVYNTV